MIDMPSLQIVVIGAASCDAGEERVAEDAGGMIANAGAVFLCGGRGGVTEVACRGAAGVGRVTIGILPGDAGEANPFCTITVPTGPGIGWNAVLVSAAKVFTRAGGAAGNGATRDHAAGNRAAGSCAVEDRAAEDRAAGNGAAGNGAAGNGAVRGGRQ